MRYLKVILINGSLLVNYFNQYGINSCISNRRQDSLKVNGNIVKIIREEINRDYNKYKVMLYFSL